MQTSHHTTHFNNGQTGRGSILKRSLSSGLLLAAILLQSAGTLLNGDVAQALPSTGSPTYSVFFSATGKTVKGSFLNTFNRFGLERMGYPISDEKQENGQTVQYFERVRMELHPELASKGYDILMTRLGADLTRNSAFTKVGPRPATSTSTYFPETGHTLSEPFLSYWKKSGSLDLFGFPISEPVQQNGLLVQWFERARFEYHPELQKTGQVVQLGQLGRTAYESTLARTAPAVQPAVQPAPVQQAKPAPVEQPANLSEMEQNMLRAVNEQRALVGLSPVKATAPISEVARSRSDDMATRNYFSHTTPEGKQFLAMLTEKAISYKYAGEILARNNWPDDGAGKTAIDTYLESPAHKAIMLDGRYNYVGVGYAKSSDGMHYFTVLFVQQ